MDRRAAYQGLVEGIREQRNPTGKDEFIAKKTTFQHYRKHTV